jgi:DNA-directed RNA polymerase specialized sigma24 family protein
MSRDVVFDFSYFLGARSPVGLSEIEQLMAEPFHTEPDYVWNDQLRDTVSQAIATLKPREQQLIEGKYVWGKSYSELSDMMGWSAKSSSYKAVKRIENKLKVILQDDPFIRVLIGEQ